MGFYGKGAVFVVGIVQTVIDADSESDFSDGLDFFGYINAIIQFFQRDLNRLFHAIDNGSCVRRIPHEGMNNRSCGVGYFIKAQKRIDRHLGVCFT